MDEVTSRYSEWSDFHDALHWRPIKYQDGYPVRENVFFIVPFEDVTHLIADHVSGPRLYLENGNAFVPKELLPQMITPKFRAFLSQQLTQTAIYWSQYRQDERIVPILKGFQLNEHSSNRWRQDKVSSTSSFSYTDVPLVSLWLILVCTSATFQSNLCSWLIYAPFVLLHLFICLTFFSSELHLLHLVFGLVKINQIRLFCVWLIARKALLPTLYVEFIQPPIH